MEAQVRPNFLFILADDLGWGDVSFHGSPIRTPNIDRLVACGVELTHHYVCPVCTPTRAALLGGRYPGRFGAHATTPSNDPVFPDGYPTLASVLRDAGYDTGLFGKWHLGSDPRFGPNNFGFNTAYGSLAGGVDPYNHRYKEGPYSRTWHRNGVFVEERGHVTDLIVREAVQWIESRTSPWFCYVPFTAVHVPVDAPSEWIDRYAFETYDDDPAKDQSFKRYAAYASHMDHGIGLLIDALKRTGQLANTLVIFASDNGAPLKDTSVDVARYPGWHWPVPRLGSNAPLRGQKGQFYEGGVRTPAVAAWPGVLQPGTCDATLFIADWMPTLTKLAGCDPLPLDGDGHDIWPLISGSAGEDAGAFDRRIYWNLRHRKFALRSGEWKLIVDEPDAEMRSALSIELYNIAEDPYERHECSREHKNVVQDLLSQLARERARDDGFAREGAA